MQGSHMAVFPPAAARFGTALALLWQGKTLLHPSGTISTAATVSAMKVLLVTSEITYVPGNNLGLFEDLCQRTSSHLAGLVLLKVPTLDVLRTAAWLYLAGAHRTAMTLARNTADLPRRRREKLFGQWGIPVLRARSANEAWLGDWIAGNRIDLVVNLRTRCRYRRQILRAPRLGCINVHHGILPRYRGTLCDLHALAAGRPAGFTIHRMNDKIDDGRILVRQDVSSGTERDYFAYLEKTGIQESRALSGLIAQTALAGSLPEGLPNKCRRPVYTCTPNWSGIRRLLALGMIL
jgi:methionyl-tRNA formyltransferase